MAERKRLDVFGGRTQPGQAPAPADLSDLDAGKVRPVGIGLRDGEILGLDGIAAEHGISRGGLMRIALRLFVRDYRAGKIDLAPYVGIPQPQRNKVILPK